MARAGLAVSAERDPHGGGRRRVPDRVGLLPCRRAARAAVLAAQGRAPDGREVDALRVLADHMCRDGDPADWPHALVLLGDQVYADEVPPDVREQLRAARDVELPPYETVANFEEYTWLYRASWSEPHIRWLLSTVPSAMIFDDHDVHDDWNTSKTWVDTMRATGWWDERIVGGFATYWLYQHMGNLSPQHLAQDDLYAALRAAGGAARRARRRPLGLADRRAARRALRRRAARRVHRRCCGSASGTDAVDTQTVLGEGDRVRVHVTAHAPGRRARRARCASSSRSSSRSPARGTTTSASASSSASVRRAGTRLADSLGRHAFPSTTAPRSTPRSWSATSIARAAGE